MLDCLLQDLKEQAPEIFDHYSEDTVREALQPLVEVYQANRELPPSEWENRFTRLLKRLVKKHIKLPRKPHAKRARTTYVAPEKKSCTKCGDEFHISAFTVLPNGRHKAACKACVYQFYYRPSSIKRLRKKGRKLKAERVLMTDVERAEARKKYKKKYRQRPEVRVANNLRSRLRKLLKKRNISRKGKLALIGCSMDELISHLEMQFQPGMSWDNYGKWHVDHIEPLCSFDLTNGDELKMAANFKNLRPLWAEENAKKSVEDVKKKKG